VRRSQRGRGGQTLFWILSLLVAVSMICGTVLVVWPSPQRQVRPTMPPAPPTATRIVVTPLPVPPTATPTPTLAAAPAPPPQPTP